MASRILQKGKNRITQAYSGAHLAVDIGRSHLTGEPITSHSAGTVVMVQTGQKNNKNATGNKSYGNFVKIDHGDGYATLYAHLASVTVQKGATVMAGQIIGTMGNTGRSFGMHLHFEVRHHNARIDPTPYLEADLPIEKNVNHVTYRAYANKWWGEIVDCNDENTNGYAGVSERAMTALMAKADKGVLRYRVHLLEENRWLNWITGYSTSDKRGGYAGNIGKAIDAVQMELVDADGYDVQYRVSLTNATGWLSWYTGLRDTHGGGYAGVMGCPIDCIQIKIVKK